MGIQWNKETSTVTAMTLNTVDSARVVSINPKRLAKKTKVNMKRLIIKSAVGFKTKFSTEVFRHNFIEVHNALMHQQSDTYCVVYKVATRNDTFKINICLLFFC